MPIILNCANSNLEWRITHAIIEGRLVIRHPDEPDLDLALKHGDAEITAEKSEFDINALDPVL